ncbi:MAG: ABC transporter ATP-binding protein [Acidobacteriota bacterium]|nr:ABC transporter ATP-binding protein [Blastocatellia bacterium]MDW8413693.1 ABC transporter ATP-binding protein [Acidobacteriota bacterium]
MLSLQNISFAYYNSPTLLDISLEVKQGELVALIGLNGSGKSTLLKLILRLLKPSSGKILLLGRDINEMQRREIARIVSFVAQNPPTADFETQEIVAMGRTPHLSRFSRLTRADREAIAEAMQLTETTAFSKRSILELSGGERQRVHIARAIAQQTELMLLDEPVASLDLAHQLEIMEILQRLAHTRGRAILLSIHDLSLAARYCDRLVVLSDKRIVADGSPNQVLTEDCLLRYFRLKAKILTSPEGSITVYPLSYYSA